MCGKCWNLNKGHNQYQNKCPSCKFILPEELDDDLKDKGFKNLIQQRKLKKDELKQIFYSR